MESFHSLGLTLLVFRVLPRLDVLHGLLLLTAVASIPAILKIVTSQEPQKRSNGVVCCISEFMDVLALLGQLSVFPLIYYME